jgi:hypothetical protein
MKTTFMWIPLILSILIVGCGDPKFDRDVAQSLITKSDEYRQSLMIVRGRPGYVDEMVAHGVIVRSGDSNVSLNALWRSQVKQRMPNGLELIGPVLISIDVTGISDDQNIIGSKSAEFVWAYEELPSLVRRYAIKGGEGQATFKLYDDGWRLQETKFEFSKEPFPLTKEEKQEIARNIEEADKKSLIAKQELDKKRLIAKQELDKKRLIAKQELDSFVEVSRTPTKILFSEVFNNRYGTYYLKYTDVHIELLFDPIDKGKQNETKTIFFEKEPVVTCAGNSIRPARPGNINDKDRLYFGGNPNCTKHIHKINQAILAWKAKYETRIAQLRNNFRKL